MFDVTNRLPSPSRDGNEHRVAVVRFGEAHPFRLLVRAPVNAHRRAFVDLDSGAHRTFAVGDPQHDVAGLVGRLQRLAPGAGVHPVDVGVPCVRVVGRHQDVVSAVAEHRKQLRVAVDDLVAILLSLERRREDAEVLAVAVDGEQAATALLAQPCLQVDRGEHEPVVVHPCEPRDVVVLERAGDRDRLRVDIDDRDPHATARRHERAQVLARRRQPHLAVAGVLEERLRRDDVGGAGGAANREDDDQQESMRGAEHADG